MSAARPLIYLDNGATTPIEPGILAGLAERQRTHFGNPSSLHAVGRRAKAALEEAREGLAAVINAAPADLIFTGGGTEALCTAVIGGASETPGRMVLSAAEHNSVREAANWLRDHRGWTLDTIPVDAEARCTPAAVEARLGPDVRLVAVMLANNEVGTVNDLPAIARVVRARAPRARLIVDAVQAVGKIPVDVQALGADHVALTAHKLHGPKGIGALWSARPFAPVFKGGGQEAGLRGGTQSAPLAWAFHAAAAAHLADMPRITALRDRLWAAIGRIDTIRLNGAPIGPERLGNNLHVCVSGLTSEPLLNALAELGLCASAGSACGKGRFSGILAAMGRTAADGAFIRLTPGRLTTEDEIDAAAAIFEEAVASLRRMYG